MRFEERIRSEASRLKLVFSDEGDQRVVDANVQPLLEELEDLRFRVEELRDCEQKAFEEKNYKELQMAVMTGITVV